MTAEEVTTSWDPYRYPWSGVVAKTPPTPGVGSAKGQFHRAGRLLRECDFLGATRARSTDRRSPLRGPG